MPSDSPPVVLSAEQVIAEALSSRWNERAKFIYPINSTPQNWIDSGDAPAAIKALAEAGYEIVSKEKTDA